MITYSAYASGKHPAIDRNNPIGSLVTGWVVYTGDAHEFEVLYARHADGRIKRTNNLRRGQPDFNKAQRWWRSVDAIPSNAVYCGNYRADMFSNEAGA